jgi:hypothetical protein
MFIPKAIFSKSDVVQPVIWLYWEGSGTGKARLNKLAVLTILAYQCQKGSNLKMKMLKFLIYKN